MIEATGIGAIILAGGKSSRMKTDKGLLSVKGKKMIAHLIDKVKPLVQEIIIVTGNSDYEQFHEKCVADIYKDCGPLGGIYTGLLSSRYAKNIVLSCDTPFIPEEILKKLCTSVGTEDVLTASHKNKFEPLIAVYDKQCLPVLKDCLDRGKLKMYDVLKLLKTETINFDTFEKDMQLAFANINTPEELSKHQ